MLALKYYHFFYINVVRVNFHILLIKLLSTPTDISSVDEVNRKLLRQLTDGRSFQEVDNYFVCFLLFSNKYVANPFLIICCLQKPKQSRLRRWRLVTLICSANKLQIIFFCRRDKCNERKMYRVYWPYFFVPAFLFALFRWKTECLFVSFWNYNSFFNWF